MASYTFDNVPLSFYRGNDATFEFQAFAEDGATPIDLDSCSFEFFVKWGAGSLSLDDAVTTDDASGKIYVPFSASQTASIPAGRGARWELRMTDSVGAKLTLATGVIDAMKGEIND